MNKIFLTGRLIKEPELCDSQEEHSMVVRYMLDVEREVWKIRAPLVDMVHCVAFDRIAEITQKYFHQGTKLAITGYIQTGNYINKNGQKVLTEVVVEGLEFIGNKVGNENRQ